MRSPWTRNGIFGFAVGSLGALVAVGFLMLDVRNEELVNSGRAALGKFEERLGMSITKNAQERTYLSDALGAGPFGSRISAWITSDDAKTERRQRWFTHRLWLRSIEAVVGLGFFAG